jgi:hypothetical protein
MLLLTGRRGGGPRLQRRLSGDHTDDALKSPAYILNWHNTNHRQTPSLVGQMHPCTRVSGGKQTADRPKTSMDAAPPAPSRPDVVARVAAVSTRASFNGARAKSGSRQIPVSACLIRLHSDYLHAEYGDLDSDYVFVNLRAGGAPRTYRSVHDLVLRLRKRSGGRVLTACVASSAQRRHRCSHRVSSAKSRSAIPHLAQ